MNKLAFLAMKSFRRCCFNICLGIIISIWSSTILKAQHLEFNNKGCGTSAPLARVINGQITWKPQVPWLVYIFVVLESGPPIRCGGSIITKDVIMTAAYCVKTGLPIARVVVLYNSTNLRENDYVDVESALVHPKYRGLRSGYDIALLKLQQPIEKFDRFVRPVCLPQQGEPTKARRMLIAGYGDIDTESDASDRILYYKASVLSDSNCSDAISTQWKKIRPKVIPLFMCSMDKNVTAYTGDSGDPVTAVVGRRSIQYGIVAFGNKRNRGPAPVIHTKVSMFIDWISQSIQRIDKWKRIRRK